MKVTEIADSTGLVKDTIVTYFGLKDLEQFKENFIEKNRGKSLYLIRFENIQGIDFLDFIAKVREDIKNANNLGGIRFGFHIMDNTEGLLMGIVPMPDSKETDIPNLDNTLGIFHANCSQKNICHFDFGIARTQCNWVSNGDEIYEVLDRESNDNLDHNRIRWSWTNFNRANTYFSSKANDAVIQPTVYYDKDKKTFSVTGGEVFVGGTNYEGYHELLRDIPEKNNNNRIELLILEKLILSCHGAPGLLKFNISPQTLLDTFVSDRKVQRLRALVDDTKLEPHNVRFELIEEHYKEKDVPLNEVCQGFWNQGFSFAADDFGLHSSSHQIALNLGQMIKEFKLDPMSFKFKPEEDNTKFLDNMAFLDYCNHLANNRNAVITAEAVDDYDTLRFLIEHQIFHFQSFLFCNKMTIEQYTEMFKEMRDLPEEIVKNLLTHTDTLRQIKETGNIFLVAKGLAE